MKNISNCKLGYSWSCLLSIENRWIKTFGECTKCDGITFIYDNKNVKFQLWKLQNKNWRVRELPRWYSSMLLNICFSLSVVCKSLFFNLVEGKRLALNSLNIIVFKAMILSQKDFLQYKWTNMKYWQFLEISETCWKILFNFMIFIVIFI